MRLTFWRVLGLSLLHLALFLTLSFMRLRHLRERVPPGDADYLGTVPWPAWWLPLLVLPPLVVAALWLWQRTRGGLTP